MVGIFTKDNRVVIMGLNDDGSILDPNGVLSDPNSMRDLATFDRTDFNPKIGQIIQICSSTKSTTQQTIHNIVKWS